MISVIAALAGVIGMVGLWALAWRLWPQPEVAPPSVSQSVRRPIWQNEPTPEHRASSPPGWVFEDEAEPGPVRREHPSSDLHTSFFVRDELDQIESSQDKTEIIADEDVFGPESEVSKPPPPPGDRKSRKTWLYSGPRNPS